MDIDYSPTGREFVTGSYDRTVRIFQYNGGHSREINHTKRMQRVFCVKFSCDASYVISGSDDTNLRLWKARASEQLGVVFPRERKKHDYHEALKNRYKYLPEVKRIVRHRHLPKPIFKATSLMRVMADTRKEKTREERLTVPQVASKQSHCGQEESSKKLSKIYVSLYLPGNRAEIYELTRIGEDVLLACCVGTPNVGIYIFRVLSADDVWGKWNDGFRLVNPELYAD